MVQAATLRAAVAQEAARYWRLVETARSIASATIRALQGRVVMSSRLESIVKELARGEVPTVIARISYKSIRGLAEWIPDLEKRIEFFRSYIDGERRRIWIPGLGRKKKCVEEICVHRFGP